MKNTRGPEEERKPRLTKKKNKGERERQVERERKRTTVVVLCEREREERETGGEDIERERGEDREWGCISVELNRGRGHGLWCGVVRTRVGDLSVSGPINAGQLNVSIRQGPRELRFSSMRRGSTHRWTTRGCTAW